jgi:predicted nucleic acid-binding protein
MKIVVDTCVWSYALRRGVSDKPEVVRELIELIKEVRVQLIGPIRQELLSGIRYKKQFDQLKSYLSAFPDLPLESQDFEKAAEYFNTCQRIGVQGSNTDFLICAVAYNYNFEIFSTDRDFNTFEENLPIKLYKIRGNI